MIVELITIQSGRPSLNHIKEIHDPLSLKLLSRLRRLGLSFFKEQRFNLAVVH